MAGFYEPRASVMASAIHTSRGGTPFGTSPTVSHTGDEWNSVYWLQKYTTCGLGRRGRPLTSQTAFGGQLPYKGSLVQPAVRFHHSSSEYNGRFLRATSHEPLFLLRAEGHSRRCRYSEYVAAKRHLSPRRPANCGLRPAGSSAPKFDERLYARPSELYQS